MTRSTFYLRQYMTKALSITLILGLLLSSLALSSGLSESLNTIAQALTTSGNWTDEGNYSINWYLSSESDGSKENPYLISTAADLAGLAYLVNKRTDNFENKIIKLTADISLEEHYWVPIGEQNYKPFKGTFDGLYGEENTHTIKNMLIGTEAELASYTFAGLFGCANGATIKNVNIDDSCKIYNDYCAGGICAYASNSTIINCTNNGIVYSNNTSAAGICSQADSQTIINNCINSGTVYASDGYVGGICAWAKETTINNCINIETVLSNGGENPNVGGICGWTKETTISNNYYKVDTAEKGIGNKDANDQEGATALVESQMTAASGIDSSSGIVDDTSWKEIKIIYGGVNINLGQMSLVDALNVGAYVYNNKNKKNTEIETALKWEIRSDKNSGYPVLEISKSGNWTDSGNYSIDWYESSGNDGSKENPYLISTAADLAGLAYLVNKRTDFFENKVIKLTADIDLKEHYWVPIGEQDYKPFKGTFDGQGYTIKNMQIGTEAELASYRFAGLFGCANGATIENVSIDEKCKIYNDYCAGGICAYASNSTIVNCSNNGIVSSNNTSAGGICSQADSQTIISNCINSGTVYASDGYVGGICAWAKETTINNNYYKADTAEKGIGNNDADVQGETTALSESQITATAGANAENDWVEIDGIGTVALVDALNAWVDDYNSKEDIEIKVLNWEIRIDENSSYPVFKNSTNTTSDSTNVTTVEEENATENVADNYTGWKPIKGDWYYFENGKMVKDDWRFDDAGDGFYLGTDGKRLNSIKYDSSSQLYKNADGTNADGIIQLGNNYYCYSEDGKKMEKLT